MSSIIHATRDSVCMGDDCTAPNAADLTYSDREPLSRFMRSVAAYVPSMKNVVWSVYSGDLLIGHLFSGALGMYRSELAVPDGLVAELPEKKIHCRYYYSLKFKDFREKPPVDLYPEAKTLLDKVKAYEAGH